MDAAEDMKPFVDLANEFGFMDAKVPDLLSQATFHLARSMRAGDHYRRTATRRNDLRSAARHIDGLRRAFGRLDTATIVSAFVGLGPREAILVEYEDGPGHRAEREGTLPEKKEMEIDPIPLRWIAFDTMGRELEVVHRALTRLIEKEPRQDPGRPPVSDAVSFGIEFAAGLWGKYKPEFPVSSSEKDRQFGLFVVRLFRLIRERLADEERLNETIDRVARAVTDAAVRRALRRFLESRKSAP